MRKVFSRARMCGMDCVCGCGTEVPRRLVPTNISAFFLALEIAEWDRLRTVLSIAREEPLSEDSPDFLDDGMYCYQSFLGVLHGEALRSDHAAYKKWRKYSRKNRKKLADEGAPIDGHKNVEATDDRLAMLNGLAPDVSYSAPESAELVRQELARARGEIEEPSSG